jgi:capsule polysaccharide export protein KpsE/RkpR
MTTLTETLTAAQDHEVAAQAAVDAATAELVAAKQAVVDAQAAIATIQPHLDILAQIEAQLVALEQGVAAETAAALETVKSTIEPLLAQLRAVFNV